MHFHCCFIHQQRTMFTQENNQHAVEDSAYKIEEDFDINEN
jgi:hypothetical protein